MANWKYHISLKDFYHSDIPIQEKGEKVANTIKKTLPGEWFDPKNEDQYRPDIDEIVDYFMGLSMDGGTVEDFDDIMEEFYNWADQEIEPFDMWPPNKMCWVETR